MVRSKIVRWAGALLILAGLAVLAFAGYTFVQNTRAEANAEALVPGRASNPDQSVSATGTPNEATSTPVVLLPELSGNDLTTVTSVPSPSETLVPAQEAPQSTSTPQMVVGPEGLPIGGGADPVRIVIPRIKLDVRVEQANYGLVNSGGQLVSDWFIPYDAVGHLSTTAEPGEAGNAVISGHHNLIGPNVFGVGKFAGLWNLKAGDGIYIYDKLGRIFQFRITQAYPLKEVGEPLSVREDHARQVLASDDTKPLLTLETCWNGAQAPLSGNTYRWIIRSELLGTVDARVIPTWKK